MKEIVGKLMKLHESQVIEEPEVTEDMEELDGEDVINESDMKSVTQSAQKVLNTYENIITELQTLKKGTGYCASNTISKQLTPDDYSKRDVANRLVLDKLNDVQYLLKSIRDIVSRAK